MESHPLQHKVFSVMPLSIPRKERMKQVIDSLTGELIDVEEANDIAIRELNELDVNFEDYVNFYIQLKYFKEQLELWEFKNKPKLMDVFESIYKDTDKKTIKLSTGSITYVKEGLTKKVDTDALKHTKVKDLISRCGENPELADMSIYDLFLMVTPRDASLRIKVNEE